MGLVIQSLAEHCDQSDYIEWRVETEKSLPKSAITATQIDSLPWVSISPDENHFKCYFKEFYL